MKKILITGGTVFVSKFAAAFYVKKGCEVYVLNRNTKEQVEGVHLICADRNNLKDELRGHSFDVIMDICGYTKADVKHLLDAVDEVKDYLFISTSAVYKETDYQPFHEEQEIGSNSLWGQYSRDKVEAEAYLSSRCPQAYIIRPPYIYGPMQNLYREPFVFECALQGRKFYIPKDGKMKLHFVHVKDLCKMMERIIQVHPEEHIFNAGSYDVVDIETWVELCYSAAGMPLEKIYVEKAINQRDYFCFADYECVLDVSRQKTLLPHTMDLAAGLQESFRWYVTHKNDIRTVKYLEFIDQTMMEKVTRELLEAASKRRLSGEILDYAGVSFKGLDLSGLDLRNMNFAHADFSKANLTGTNFRYSNLSYVNMAGTNLLCANLENTDLTGIVVDNNTQFYSMKCPGEGAFVAYKKCFNDRVVQLLVPEDAKRCSATNPACRCNKAKVLSIKSIDLKKTYEEATSYVDENFVYRVGEYVTVTDFNDNRWMDSTTGIHFFMTREEAVGYL